MSVRFQEKEIILACRTLFGPEVELSPDFLGYLQASGAKAAFREKAKLNHPDLFAAHDQTVQHRQAEMFRELRDAFELINDFLKHRDKNHGQSIDQILVRSSLRRPYRPTTPPATRSNPSAGNYYVGTVPLRRLEFGSYLYYRGLVSYQLLIEALVWQRRQRPTIGEIARRWNWLSEAEALHICRDRGGYGRFGEKAVRLGLLRHTQVQTLLCFQRSRQQKIGQYFIEAGALSANQIEPLAAELQAHNARINGPPANNFKRESAPTG